MSKLKLGMLFFATLFVSLALKAQTIEEGRKFLYYERYKSAKAVFEKLVAANPNNTEAVYWLGQAMIGSDDDIASVKALYQKSLIANSGSPILIAGMGHVELLENKNQDARNRFETAISLSQAKNYSVLNAIGFANVMAKSGDANYAIDKLKQATTLKGMKDPDVYTNLGDAYKIITDGGNAQKSYEAALELNPTYTRASYRIGKIYQTQGIGQEEIYMRYYNDAIAKDPAYGPVYENLYQYYYLSNVGKAAGYLDKFLNNSDEDPKNCYYRASMKYAQALFTEAISKADECIAAGGTTPYPNLFGLKAYAYQKLGDSINAKASFEKYFSKQKEDKIGPTDYKTYAEVLLVFPGNEITAGNYIDKAVLADSTEAGKAALLKTMAVNFENQKRFKEAADWYNKIVSISKIPRKIDLYYAGYNYFRSGDYPSSIAVFNVFSQIYPDDAFSYYMIGKANWAIDSTLSQGLANASFEKTIEVALVDSVKYKNQLIGSYKYFIVYYASSPKKDKALALNFCDKVLSLDSTDAETISNKVAISSMNMSTPATPKQSKQKQGAGKSVAEKSSAIKNAATKKK